MSKPFLPQERPEADPLKLWRRHALSVAIARMRNTRPVEIVRHYWGSEPGVVDAIAKAATAPASSGGWGRQLAGSSVGPFIGSLAPVSAAARLFQAALRVNLTGHNVAMLPGRAKGFPDAVFVGEGQPIPAMAGVIGGVELGPQRKLAAFAGVSADLADYSAEEALTVIEITMRDAAARALDSAVFSDAAASDLRPAGLLAGVTPITAALGSDVASVMSLDLANLAGAIGDAGGGTGVLYFANPRQATAIQLRSPSFAELVVPTSRLPDGTVVAIETGAIASAFDGLPQVDVSTATAIHWEDANPAQIATAGSPNIVAAPVSSMFQVPGYALRLILRCAWASRMSGAVQMVTGATW